MKLNNGVINWQTLAEFRKIRGKSHNRAEFIQLTFTCSKSTIETVEKGVKYV